MHEVMDGRAAFTDAVAVWHMHDLSNVAGGRAPLQAVGPVELGCDMSDAKREESTRRGGDGKAALFVGTGWLQTEDDMEGVNLSPEAFSIALRLNATKEGGIFYNNLFSMVVFGQGLLIGFLGVKSDGGALYRDIPMTRIAFNQSPIFPNPSSTGSSPACSTAGSITRCSGTAPSRTKKSRR